jgi:signal transduction histidine kinase
VTTNVSGTGLGLAITKRIVTAHKGTINLESYPGGTMFHVFLPKAE